MHLKHWWRLHVPLVHQRSPDMCAPLRTRYGLSKYTEHMVRARSSTEFCYQQIAKLSLEEGYCCSGGAVVVILGKMCAKQRRQWWADHALCFRWLHAQLNDVMCSHIGGLSTSGEGRHFVCFFHFDMQLQTIYSASAQQGKFFTLCMLWKGY